jgi:hypothetical protein
MTPFGGRLITEVIGCSSADPDANPAHSTPYYQGKNGYLAANATNKFIRMRLNNGIVPLGSIRGGACAGRTDGLCSLNNFLTSQKNASSLANYQYTCFANYSSSVANPLSGQDFDGTISS